MDEPRAFGAGDVQRALNGSAKTLWVLGCRVDRVDMDGAVARIEEFLGSGKPARVVTLGAEMANHAYADASYREAVNGADLVVADTIGVVLAARLLGKPLRERVAGVDLVSRLCERAARSGYPVYLLGGHPGIAEAAADTLRRRFSDLHVAGTHHGYFSDDETPQVCARIRDSGARIVFVGLGFPRQEYWIRENLRKLGTAVCMGVGGSFDVLGGKIARAPLAVRRFGLEWLYRLVREPRRFGRQLALPAFAARSVRQALFGPR